MLAITPEADARFQAELVTRYGSRFQGFDIVRVDRPEDTCGVLANRSLKS